METICQGFSVSYPWKEVVSEQVPEDDLDDDDTDDGVAADLQPDANDTPHVHNATHLHNATHTHNIVVQQPATQPSDAPRARPLVLDVKKRHGYILYAQIVLVVLYGLLVLPHFSGYRWVGFGLALRLVKEFAYHYLTTLQQENPESDVLRLVKIETRQVLVRTNRRVLFALLATIYNGFMLRKTALSALLQWLFPVPSSALFLPQVLGLVFLLEVVHVTFSLAKKKKTFDDVLLAIFGSVLVQLLLWYTL